MGVRHEGENTEADRNETMLRNGSFWEGYVQRMLTSKWMGIYYWNWIVEVPRKVCSRYSEDRDKCTKRRLFNPRNAVRFNGPKTKVGFGGADWMN